MEAHSMNDPDAFVTDLMNKACEHGMELTHAAKCAAEVWTRLTQGRGFDCDEYRELTRVAFYYDEPTTARELYDRMPGAFKRPGQEG